MNNHKINLNINPDMQFLTIINDCLYNANDLKTRGALGILEAEKLLEYALKNADYLGNIKDRNKYKNKIKKLIAEL